MDACVSHSIDSASAPQQPYDPSVLLMVTPPGLRASARTGHVGRAGLWAALHNLAWENEEKEEIERWGEGNRCTNG